MNENRFYVYIHVQHGSAEPFYVGKGTRGRAWSDYQRSDSWRLKAAVGYSVILCQDGMNEDDAYLLEMWLIAKFWHQGVDIVNVAKGGRWGVVGPRPKRMRKVYCSNGMLFESIKAAAKYATNGGNWVNAAAKIGECARGKRLVCHGHAWSFDAVPPQPRTIVERAREKRGAKVICGNGMEFGSIVEAVDWMRSNVKATAGYGRIIHACKGRTDMAYGLKWQYAASSTEGVGR